MKPSTTYPKTVAAVTVASGLLALLCLVLLGVALADSPEAIYDPVKIIDYPGINWALLRGSMLADLAGYYLLLLPLIYYLRPYLQAQTPWADVITFCGTAYAWGGAIGAAVLSEVGSRLYADYYAAAPAERAAIRAAYQVTTYLVYDGFWNLTGSLLAGAWWLLTGYFLTGFHRATARTAMVLGTGTALSVLGKGLGLGWLAEAGLNVYLVLAPAWAVWIGVVVWRRSRQTEPLPEPYRVA
jgi:hypothetical protein